MSMQVKGLQPSLAHVEPCSAWETQSPHFPGCLLGLLLAPFACQFDSSVAPICLPS